MNPYYERAGIRIFHGDARQVLPELVDERFDAVVTDPVWPDVKQVRLTGFEEARELFAFAAHHAAIFADRLVVYLSRETDPRFLSGVPASLPYLCTSWLRFIVPRPVGRILRGANVAYTFGAAPPSKPGAHIMPGASSPFDSDAEQVEGSDANDGRRLPKRLHPCPMQPGHAKWLVKWFGGSTVLDPFCGSGTVLVAAKEHGITATGIEIEERFCEVAAKRLAQDTLFPPEVALRAPRAGLRRAPEAP